MKKVKITILGTGNIAHILANTMSKEPLAELRGVAGITIEDAQKFAKEFGIPNAFSSYEEAIADEETDLIYIALPHTFHYPMSKAALLAGKHVLCEKPISINAKLAEELFDLAKKKNLFISEAMWTRFLPSVNIVKNLLEEKVIGEPNFLLISMGCDVRFVKRMIDPNLAGGMLLDCGIYAVASMLLLFGEQIKSISTSGILSEEGVDLRSTTAVVFEDGKLASINLAMDSLYDDKFMISGDKGRIEIDVPFNWQNIRVILENGDVVQKIDIPKQTCGGYEYEIKGVCEAIVSGKTYCEETAPEKILFQMRFMDNLREQWGLVYPDEK